MAALPSDLPPPLPGLLSVSSTGSKDAVPPVTRTPTSAAQTILVKSAVRVDGYSHDKMPGLTSPISSVEAAKRLKQKSTELTVITQSKQLAAVHSKQIIDKALPNMRSKLQSGILVDYETQAFQRLLKLLVDPRATQELMTKLQEKYDNNLYTQGGGGVFYSRQFATEIFLPDSSSQFFWRGCTPEQLLAIISTDSAGGLLPNPETLQPKEEFVRLQVKGDKDKPEGTLPEFSTSPQIAITYSTGSYIAVVKIELKYLLKGSVSEFGMACNPDAPVKLVKWMQGRRLPESVLTPRKSLTSPGSSPSPSSLGLSPFSSLHSHRRISLSSDSSPLSSRQSPFSSSPLTASTEDLPAQIKKSEERPPSPPLSTRKVKKITDRPSPLPDIQEQL